MARYDVTCEDCGTVFEVQLTGPSRDREWKLKSWTWVCDDCKEKAKLAASEKAAKEAEDVGLPELDGTEKQIRWAEVLRLEIIERIDKFISVHPAAPGKEAELAALVLAVKGQKSSHYWIDHRENSAQGILEEYRRRNPQKSESVKALESEAATEITVRPAKVVSETIAEIRAFQDRVEIKFPERRDEFWGLIKKELGYTWSGSAWVRKISKWAGTPEDRAAEAGNRILASGFPIRIHDERIRQIAIDGTFEPECKQWVLLRTGGQYNGWFAIWWKEGDFYGAAKRIRGARYDKPHVVVPTEHFEEVLDFAGIHGFRLSEGAQEASDKARGAKESALEVYIQGPPKQIGKSKGRPKLDAPEIVDIPRGLRD